MTNQISQARVKSKTSKSKRKNTFVIKYCLFCGDPYKGSPQSKYCSKYHMECASRQRKEALVEALANLMHERSQELTHTVYGVGFQITTMQALAKAQQCVRQDYITFQYKLSALGYIYNESARAWQLQSRLPPPLPG